MTTHPFFERVYGMVRRIPPGRVASYGQIAGLCEHAHAARTVGWALNGMPRALADPGNPRAIPWWRVINAAGGISTCHWDGNANLQQVLLEAEGVEFSPEGRVDMGRFRWDQWEPPLPADAPPADALMEP